MRTRNCACFGPERHLNDAFTSGSGEWGYAVALMRKTSTILLTIAIVVVVALAVAIHLYGPSLGRAIHGGQ